MEAPRAGPFQYARSSGARYRPARRPRDRLVGSQTDPRWLRGRAVISGPSQSGPKRDPPVEIGDVETVAISEFTDHHSGERQAVGKIEGFVVFVEDVPGAASRPT